jgi:hypothetical protein
MHAQVAPLFPELLRRALALAEGCGCDKPASPPRAAASEQVPGPPGAGAAAAACAPRRSGCGHAPPDHALGPPAPPRLNGCPYCVQHVGCKHYNAVGGLGASGLLCFEVVCGSSSSSCCMVLKVRSRHMRGSYLLPCVLLVSLWLVNRGISTVQIDI